MTNLAEISKDYHFFWGGPFSQWYPSSFNIERITYNCAEQYMMAEKARLFNDTEALAAIMKSKDPSQQKGIGRKVKGFDVDEWNNICRLVVYRGNLAKFSQNLALRDFLTESGEQIIVEASPEDKIWGIGLHESDPDVMDESKWKGLNWLGIAIMQVRADIQGNER